MHGLKITAQNIFTAMGVSSLSAIADMIQSCIIEDNDYVVGYPATLNPTVEVGDCDTVVVNPLSTDKDHPVVLLEFNQYDETPPMYFYTSYMGIDYGQLCDKLNVKAEAIALLGMFHEEFSLPGSVAGRIVQADPLYWLELDGFKEAVASNIQLILDNGIDDDCYASIEDAEEGVNSIHITLAANKDASWATQEGDNSFSGSAYGYEYWAVGTIYEDTDPMELAGELINQLSEVTWS